MFYMVLINIKSYNHYDNSDFDTHDEDEYTANMGYSCVYVIFSINKTIKTYSYVLCEVALFSSALFSKKYGSIMKSP